MLDENYEVAVKLLKDEFLDEPKMIDSAFKRILEKVPQYDAQFQGLRMYVAEIKGIISDLKTSHKVDLTVPESGGYKFVSHIIFSKIPSVIQRSLIAKSKSNYPTLDNIFENIKEVIETYNKTKPTTKKSEPINMLNGQNWKPNSSSMDVSSKGGATSGTLHNFHTKSGQMVFYCKFCDVEGHSSYYCSKYRTLDQRKDRCKELKLCFKCTSNKHLAKDCPGKTGNL